MGIAPYAFGLVALAGAILIGCPGSLEDPERFAGAGGSVTGNGAPPKNLSDCPDVPSAILAASCTNPGCHNSQDRMQGLDLQAPDVGTRLHGKSASEGAGLLVDPDVPARSVLYTKVTSRPPFGARMPLTGPLDDDQVACVLAWITSIDAPNADTGGADAGGAHDASDAGDEGEP